MKLLFYLYHIIMLSSQPFLNSLWGGSVINLGTEKHREKYFDGIDNLDYPGCFAMTELHHGELLS
jgi:alkylation response protein AidB-like acyl-CoA dehydrogenase